MQASTSTTDSNPLYDYKGLNFALYRQAIKTNIPIKNFSTDPNPDVVTKQQVISEFSSQKNTTLLTNLIISKNSIGQAVDQKIVFDKVTTFIQSWINMGKFDKLNSFLSFNLMINYYNKEFISAFANTILPVDVVKVKSVTNPNGMYAQQTRTLAFKSKPPPFWERALYKRLEDRVRDVPIDETEDLFYKFELTGKKIPTRTNVSDIYEREEFHFRMNPKY
jgi:hypothetical protein